MLFALSRSRAEAVMIRGVSLQVPLLLLLMSRQGANQQGGLVGADWANGALSQAREPASCCLALMQHLPLPV